MRRIATFMLWLGLFGLFLTFAAYSTGETRLDLAAGSLLFIAFAWLILRKPAVPFKPERRFRSLRKLGLLGRKPEEKVE